MFNIGSDKNLTKLFHTYSTNVYVHKKQATMHLKKKGIKNAKVIEQKNRDIL